MPTRKKSAAKPRTDRRAGVRTVRDDLADARAMKRRQEHITELARAIRRATRRADVARLDAARELCADTGYSVIGDESMEMSAKTLREECAENERLREELSAEMFMRQEAQRQIEDLIRERDELRARAAAHA